MLLGLKSSLKYNFLLYDYENNLTSTIKPRKESKNSVHLFKPVECTIPRMNYNINSDFRWIWCVNVGSLIVTNIPVWWGMQIWWRIHMYGDRINEKSILLPLILLWLIFKSLNTKHTQKPTANMLPFPKGRDLIPSIESQAPEAYSQTLKPKWNLLG